MNICKKIYTLSIIVLMLLSTVSVQAQNSPPEKDQILIIGCMDLSAMCEIDKEGQKSGVLYDLYKEIAIRAGLKYEIKFLPAPRTVLQLDAGKIDMMLGGSNDNKLWATDKLSYLFSTNRIIVAHKDSGIKTLDDLSDKNIARIGDAFSPSTDGTAKKTFKVRDYNQLMQMLYWRSAVDAISIRERAYYYYLRTLDLDPQLTEIIHYYEPSDEHWIYVNRNMSKETRDKIDQAVEELKKENMIEMIFNKYGYINDPTKLELLN